MVQYFVFLTYFAINHFPLSSFSFLSCLTISIAIVFQPTFTFLYTCAYSYVCVGYALMVIIMFALMLVFVRVFTPNVAAIYKLHFVSFNFVLFLSEFTFVLFS